MSTQEGAPLVPSRKFENAQEELEFLRAQVAEKERQLSEQGQKQQRDSVVHETLRSYGETLAHDVLTDTHQMSQSEVEATILDLPADDDDAVMAELLGVLQEKGIKNALTVAERQGSPHIADDFHRLLVQYVAHGYSLPDVKEKAPLWNLLNMSLLEVSIPDMRGEGERPIRELISAMEQFYLGMFSIADADHAEQRHFVMEIAVSGDREDIVFYIAVPRDKETLFEKQLLSVFPKARLHPLPADYNIFVHEGATEGAYATLLRDAAMPLRDYRDFDHDPLSVLIGGFTKIATTGEGAAFQVVIHPVGDRYQSRYRKVLQKMLAGMKLTEALKDTPESLGGEAVKILKEFAFSGKKKDESVPREPPMPETDKIEELKKKLETPIPQVNIRVLASASDRFRASAIVDDILSSFNQFENTTGNSIKWKRATGKDALELARQYSFRRFESKQSLPLSLREVATLMHFPTGSAAHTPQLKQAKAAEAPAPIGLPTAGTLLGVNKFRGVHTNIYLSDEDRLRHLYVIGQTGTGKTTIMKNMIVQDIERGAGICFIDPHGSDVADILASVPEERFDDVIYFDPAETQHVMGLNMLEYDPKSPEQKTFVVNELLSIFKKLYSGSPESMGPAFEQYFRNATMLVMEDPSTGNTMLDISRVLADARYRELKLARSKNPVVNQFWREIATKAQGEASLQNIVPYITNKFDVFTANEIMRPIIAQQTSSFNLRDVMDSRKILLVNLSKGRLGDMNAYLLGLILVGKILQAALSRVDSHGTDMPHFYLYLDEFQNVSTDSISAILSEARKYKLSLTIAHQFIAQLEESIKDAVFGNVGSMAVFRVGADDAQFLESQFAPTFSAQDIMQIENRHAYLKVLANGTPQIPFSIGTAAPKQTVPERGERLKQYSWKRYARERATVENEIAMRYGLR